MSVNKVYVGEVAEEALQIQYFVIQKESFYGIALEQHHTACIECDYEYFTEKAEDALHLAKLMYTGKVTLTSMAEIIDDYIQ